MFHLLAVVALTSYMLLVFGCGPQPSNEMIYSGPDRQSDIVYYFKKGTTNDQVNYFLDHDLGVPHPNGKGYDFIPGIQGDFRVITQDYEGYALELRHNVTNKERQNILNVIKNSPLIFKVFENVVPNEIILDSVIAKKEKEELEKAKNDNRPTKRMVVTTNSENK